MLFTIFVIGKCNKMKFYVDLILLSNHDESIFMVVPGFYWNDKLE